GTIAALPRVRAVVAGADPARVLAAAGVANPQVDPVLRRFRTNARAWLKIQDGCDERCTFCATTLARGANRSRPMAELVREARALAAHHAEIVLTGVHIGTYGRDGAGERALAPGLGALLEALIGALPALLPRGDGSGRHDRPSDDRRAAPPRRTPARPPPIGLGPRAAPHGAALVHRGQLPGPDRVARRPAPGVRPRRRRDRRVPGRDRGGPPRHAAPGRGVALHVPARLPVQRPARCAGGTARGGRAPGRRPRPRPRAAPARRGQGRRLPRRPHRAARRRRGERPAGGEGGGRDGGLPFGLFSRGPLGRPRPLRGDDPVSMPRVYIETYGCQMNVADSDLLAGVLGRAGYARTGDPAEADVVLVNTCAVRDHAEQRVLSRLGELKRYKRPGGVLGVVGCMAQRLGARLLERVPQVDLVIGPDGYRGLPELVARARAGARTADVRFRAWEHYEDVPPLRAGAPSAFVTVQRGCDYRCTFCIVPMTRGPERSRKLEDVVREVAALAARGTTEVTLLGQTVNSYHDGAHDSADLLRAVGAVPGIRRVRFTSPYPTDFTDRVLAAMADTPTVCEHVHLPAQSGSSRVLKRMLRRYDRARYLDVVRALRAAVPGLALTTDLIVGFPGETEADFEETLSLVEEVGFDDAYTFKFSPREGTPATPWRASGSPGSSRWCARRPGARTSRCSARLTRCWSRAGRSGAHGSRAGPARTRSRCFPARTSGSARTGGCASRAPRVPRSPRRRSRRSSRPWGDERHLRGGRPRVRAAARPTAPVLRVRHLSRRRAGVRAQPAHPALRLHAPGQRPRRAAARERSGAGEARRGLARGIPQSRAGAAVRRRSGAARLNR